VATAPAPEDIGRLIYDERRVVMLKSKLDVLEQQNKNLKKELGRKDNAFMKCGDLCAFLSQVFSNEYVTLQRTKEGFKEPLGSTLMRDQ
jgi:hypothetical protein